MSECSKAGFLDTGLWLSRWCFTRVEWSVRLASCPRCGKPRPSFDSHTVTCQRCQQTTQLTTSAAFLKKANALWPEADVTLRSNKRVLSLIEQHDEWLKECGWYDIITATLDANWTGEEDEYVNDPDAE